VAQKGAVSTAMMTRRPQFNGINTGNTQVVKHWGGGGRFNLRRCRDCMDLIIRKLGEWERI
jgi:hypothetical protein